MRKLTQACGVEECCGRAVVAPCGRTSPSLGFREGFWGEVGFELSLRMSELTRSRRRLGRESEMAQTLSQRKGLLGLGGPVSAVRWS